jgi:hypothetical protein
VTAAVDPAPFGSAVPAEVRAAVEEAEGRIMGGSLQVFPGMDDRALLQRYAFDLNGVGEMPPPAGKVRAVVPSVAALRPRTSGRCP